MDKRKKMENGGLQMGSGQVSSTHNDPVTILGENLLLWSKDVQKPTNRGINQKTPLTF